MKPTDSARQSSSLTDDPACLLPWDSAFFDARIARVSVPRLHAEFIAKLLSWCSSEQIDCLYFLAPLDDVQTIRAAEENDFRFVDIRVKLELPLTNGVEEPKGIRTVRPVDITPMKLLASRSFTNTRFYNDAHFSRQKCDELYSTWFERSCEGYSDCVLIAERQSCPAGFITCSLQNGEGVIGLLAVDQTFQGCGVGYALVAAALRYFHDHGMKRATVVTQGGNVASQRLYQRCGFLTREVKLWYHRWRTA